MPRCVLGFGSNLQDRAAQLSAALAGLTAHGAIRSVVCSGLYESPALLDKNAPQEWNIPYLNMVAMADTTLEPMALLAVCQAQEVAQGKIKLGHWAPRCIDIDLLDYDSQLFATPDLALPHPQLHVRDFVLLPWAELAPHWCHPLLGLTIEELADTLPRSARRVAGPPQDGETT